jgi:hypothetical protein
LTSARIAITILHRRHSPRLRSRRPVCRRLFPGRCTPRVVKMIIDPVATKRQSFAATGGPMSGDPDRRTTATRRKSRSRGPVAGGTREDTACGF